MMLRPAQLGQGYATWSIACFGFLLLLLFYFKESLSTLAWKKYTLGISYCPPQAPNLILSSMDGAKWQDQIFKFMESLEVALAKEVLQHQRSGQCLPAPVFVKIIVPRDVSENLSPSFKALIHRFSHLDFPGSLPDPSRPSVLTRFIGWSNLMANIGSLYNRVLVMDLDIIFQRNPFSIQLPEGADLMFFNEWLGMKLGQQKTHYDWHHGCINSSGDYESEAQFQSYAHQEIICDGTTLGTVDAIRVYLDMMATDIQKTEFGCNDQAMHQHIYYSGLLQHALTGAGLGEVSAVENEKSEIGTIGWVPFVRYNHFGEILSEQGEVQAVVHQFKAHPKLVSIINSKYAWLADPGSVPIPEMPELLEDKGWADMHAHDQNFFRQYTRLKGVTDQNCTQPDQLCSCWFQGCHVDYAPHIVNAVTEH